jgi:hypothetical protein
MAVAGALAIGVMIAFLMVGRARAAEPAVGWWTPVPAETYQDLPTGPSDRSMGATVHDVDRNTASRATIAALQAEGRRVPCCLDAGSWTLHRPDPGGFTGSVEDRAVERWEDDRRLDTRWMPMIW